MYIYVNNESNYDVSFDNLRINHKIGNVIEVNNYYPYGMLNKSMGWQLSGNNYKYPPVVLIQ